MIMSWYDLVLGVAGLGIFAFLVVEHVVLGALLLHHWWVRRRSQEKGGLNARRG